VAVTARGKHDMPGWFPFALVTSLFMVVGFGIRAKGKLAADQPPAPPPPPQPPTPPPVQQAGVLRDWFAGDYRI
jgi:hypothetical protein